MASHPFSVDGLYLASFAVKVAAGMAAGAVGGFVGSPADLTNIRMQNDGRLPPEQRRNYKNAIDGLIRIVREEGPLTLFRGVTANVNRAMLMTASQLASYDQFKFMLISTGYFGESKTTHFSASLLAGLVATTVCSPVDVIKTRVMNDKTGEYTSALQAWSKTLKQEGFTAFFKGWVPSFVRLGPQTILTFVFLEQLRLLYNTYG